MSNLIKMKYHAFDIESYVIKELETKTEYVVTELVKSFSEVEEKIVSCFSLYHTDCLIIKQSVADQLITLSHAFTKCTLESMMRCYKNGVNQLCCWQIRINFLDKTPLVLTYFNKQLAETEHQKLVLAVETVSRTTD